MKKRIVKIFSSVAIIALTFSTGVYANALYTEWKGSDDYRQTKENMSLIEDAFNTMFSTNEDLYSENQSLRDEVENLKTEKSKLVTDNASLRVEKEGLTDKVSNMKAVLTEKENQLKESEQELQNIELIYNEVKTQLTQLIKDTNNSNGKGNRYNILSDKVNQLAGYVGIDGRVDSNVGNGQKSNELKQAEKDMEDLKNQSEELLEKVEE